MDYKFIPLSSSKAGFEHGIKNNLGKHHAESIRILSNSFSVGFFYAFARKLVWCPLFSSTKILKYEQRIH